MIYTITVNYNAKGQKLTNSSSIVLQMERNFKPSEADVKSFVTSEIPEMMIESYKVEDTNLSQLKVGDLVKLTQTITTKYNQETHVNIVKIIDINEIGIKVENVNNYFLLNGVEKTRKKKDIAKIEIPTELELQEYEDKKLKTELIEEIHDLIENETLCFCTNDELAEIINIMKTAYRRW